MSLRYSLGNLAIPAVLGLISFLALSSQWLFATLQPGHLSLWHSSVFNGLILVLLVCYARAVLVNPGYVPKGWKPEAVASDGRQRWCRKCEAYKPPRAHHCKMCGRCIPKMDHHCPWTANCVSHVTYPHFLRFIGYADLALIYLEYFLFQRAAIIWEDRHMPSYHGPSVFQLAHLFILLVVNSMTLFALGILFIRAVWCLVVNTYTIEGWEIERHEVLLRRARVLGGYLDGPDGRRIRLARQEFPYDIGFWENIVQGMATSNVLAWIWPFAASPTIDSGLAFETNGFEDASISWPPPDPDRMPRQPARFAPADTSTHTSGYSKEDIESFRLRQEHDLNRTRRSSYAVQRRPLFHNRFDNASPDAAAPLDQQLLGANEQGEESWRNSEGDSLADYGIDEEAEFYDEEEVPLAELVKPREMTNENA